jgi:hypothetical protein
MQARNGDVTTSLSFTGRDADYGGDSRPTA